MDKLATRMTGDRARDDKLLENAGRWLQFWSQHGGAPDGPAGRRRLEALRDLHLRGRAADRLPRKELMQRYRAAFPLLGGDGRPVYAPPLELRSLLERMGPRMLDRTFGLLPSPEDFGVYTCVSDAESLYAIMLDDMSKVTDDAVGVLVRERVGAGTPAYASTIAPGVVEEAQRFEIFGAARRRPRLKNDFGEDVERWCIALPFAAAAATLDPTRFAGTAKYRAALREEFKVQVARWARTAGYWTSEPLTPELMAATWYRFRRRGDGEARLRVALPFELDAIRSVARATSVGSVQPHRHRRIADAYVEIAAMLLVRAHIIAGESWRELPDEVIDTAALLMAAAVGLTEGRGRPRDALTAQWRAWLQTPGNLDRVRFGEGDGFARKGAAAPRGILRVLKFQTLGESRPTPRTASPPLPHHADSYSVPAFAKLVDVSPPTIRKLLRSGDIQAVHVGRAVLLPASELPRARELVKRFTRKRFAEMAGVADRTVRRWCDRHGFDWKTSWKDQAMVAQLRARFQIAREPIEEEEDE